MVASAVAVTVGLFVGAGDLDDPQIGRAVLNLRLARVAVAYLAGGALAIGGVLVQGLFRNPLASPSLVGAAAGANLGGQVTVLTVSMFLGNTLPAWIAPDMFLPLGCLAGGLGALVLLRALTRQSRNVVVLLLVGFLLNSLFLSLSSFVTSIAQESWELGRALIAFALGDIGGSGFRHVLMLLPFVVLGLPAALIWAGSLDMLLSGEEEAQTLGLDVGRVQRWG